MITEMENDVLELINPKPEKMIDKAHLLISKEMVNSFWNEYFESCEMSTPETGLEMPHEEDLTYSYHPNADEYNSRYGW